jgi:putative heme-binding domain-containing protein
MLHRSRWRFARRTILLSCSVILLMKSSAPPAYGWLRPGTVDEEAGQKLKVLDGLIVWLDAAQVALEEKSVAGDDLKKGQPIVAWPNQAGLDSAFQQPDPKRRPLQVSVGTDHLVRFDGEDDHLRLEQAALSTGNATIFIVAAPHSNLGEFRGLFAANEADQRDYESGFTIDLGPGPTFRFDQLNVEGRGFGGAQNLLNTASPYGTLRTLEVTIDSTGKKLGLVVDGNVQGNRDFLADAVSLQQLTVGSRFYTNGPGRQEVRGPFHGDLAEILIYNRVLSPPERDEVRSYLTTRYERLAAELPRVLNLSPDGGITIQKIENPPQIQMMIPGFTVQAIPLELTNVNNVRYRHDGRLLTLGYNGDIHLLSDTDGDGIEDRVDMFWKNQGSLRGPLGMLPTPKGYPKGNGVFVPSKGKVSLIVDTNGDDQADEEIIVASGWKEIPQNVDALGIAMDAEGSLYFGLGTVNFANAYLVNDQGKGEYDLNSDRGTVQKVSPDFSKREVIGTGIRFPIAFAFNQHGDLFCSEQEGATWLPNGNPLDELLHIRLDGKGPNGVVGAKRHYGFPPRHPQHNPTVIDEPSTFDYGPQHQSTCGMVFNQPTNGGPTFGPAWWENDALVCGESRGKLWRTQLVKTEAGYIAASQLIACLQMLTVDACVSPSGDLIVACHSGPPDWGTGPTGIGKLFRIRMNQNEVARPIMAWAESPQEIRIAFDRPVDPASYRKLAESIEIQHGRHVKAGDHFENLVPPYAVVRSQMLQPRYRLDVSSASLTSDLQTMIITTSPMTVPNSYAIRVPMQDATTDSSDAAEGMVTQLSELNTDLSLNGLLAEWKPSDAGVAWTGWLPHPDLQVSQALLHNSGGHAELWKALEQPGLLTLRTRMNVKNILRPAVQPGAKIDYEWPAETASVTFTSNRSIVVAARQIGEDSAAPVELSVVCDQSNVELQRATFQTSADLDSLIEVQITIQTGKSTVPQLTATVSTNEDSDPRPLQLHRFVLPWISPGSATEFSSKATPPPELAGGNWARGRQIFRSETAGCFKCHVIGGATTIDGKPPIGPDLSNLIHRDYASVVRDITNPSFSINPDYIGHVLAMNDGRVLKGIVQSVGEQLLVADEKGERTAISRAEIELMNPSTTSVMPTGIPQKLNAEQMKDLLTYLMIRPPQMPLDSPLPAPPLRTQDEVDAALVGAPVPPAPVRPLNIVLVDGPKDHGPGEHDYPAWKSAWEVLLSAASDVTVSTAHEFPEDEQLQSADVLVFFQKGSFVKDRPAKLDGFLNRGGGAVYVHWAVNGDDQVHDFAQRIGYASWGGRIAFRHGPLTLDIHNQDHPIVRNFQQIQLYDESYWKLTGQPEGVTLLATSTEDGQPTPQMWTVERGKGRVFVSIPGHYNWSFDDPLFRILLLRGIAWTAGEPVDRFNDIVPLGARMITGRGTR